MIIAQLSEFGRYQVLHHQFAKVNEFLKTYKFDVPNERVFIDSEKLFLIPALDNAREKDKALLEAHNRYIDIQICLEGRETFGWKNRVDCVSPKGEFDDEKDIIFYDDKPSFYFDLIPNQLAIFFPEDCHAPLIGNGQIKKLIFKVEV